MSGAKKNCTVAIFKRVRGNRTKIGDRRQKIGNSFILFPKSYSIVIEWALMKSMAACLSPYLIILSKAR